MKKRLLLAFLLLWFGLLWTPLILAQDDTRRSLPEGALAFLPETEGHTGSVLAVSFSPDGKTLASSGGDGTVRLWDVYTGAPKKTLYPIHQSRIWSVSFSPDGSLIAGGGSDQIIQIWDVDTGTPVDTLGSSGSVNSISFSPDGKTLASAHTDTVIRLWDVGTGSLKMTLEGIRQQGYPGGGVGEWEVFTSVSFSPDGTTLISGSFLDGGAGWYCCGRVTFWDIGTGSRKRTLRHWLFVSSVSMSPDGSTLAISGQETGDDCSKFCPSSVQLREVSTGTLQRKLEHFRSVSFSPDGSLLAGVRQAGVRIYDVATGTLRTTLEGHTNQVLTVSFSPDGSTIASGSSGSTSHGGRDYKKIRLWNASTGAMVNTLEGHSDRIASVTFSPDGKILASGSWDATIRLWEVSMGTLQTTLEGHSGEIMSVSFSLDGKILASGSRDGTIRLWETRLGAIKWTLEGHSGAIRSVTFSPDGAILASGSLDGTIRLWEVSTGTLRTTLEGHSGGVLSVTFSPDGKILASGSDDARVLLWDMTPYITNSMVSAVQEPSPTHPAQTVLQANYPNPFNLQTSIPYQLHRPSRVLMRIYDVRGALIRVLDHGYRAVGSYRTEWDGRDRSGQRVASGAYMYQLRAGPVAEVRKMLLTK